MTEARAKYLEPTENILQSDIVCLASAAQSLSSNFFPWCFHTFYFHNKQQMSPPGLNLRNWSFKQQPCRLTKWHEKTLQNALQHYNMKAFEGLSLTNVLSNISQGKTSCEVRHPVKILSSSSPQPGNCISPEQMKHHFLIVQLSTTVVT